MRRKWYRISLILFLVVILLGSFWYIRSQDKTARMSEGTLVMAQ
ncbi:MAG: hypothetical protein ACI4CC_03625 [Lachnospiraceae bacterium]